ncbi:twin-arginine translocase subunit TatC [Rhodovastum atsumiense]|uniref:Sec-independent protein translocase protein TatC n=1 Tax=Rhodovastum atsumiense TaxID=504468 RepID=A0A5M6IM57_9PROT|nr:twin-arginine translocase subunit TatC [Rhodovastum atsumiense]KAA5609312.1 twin-arginine translocase subunit TatC [Rhodovastum atsumiense]
MPLLDHLIELRRRLLWALAAFVVCFFITYHFSADIYSFLAKPLADLMEARGENRRMIFTALYEAFFTDLKVAFFAAAFISFPVVAGQIWLFVAPGLYRSEKRALLPFLCATPLLFLLGGALAYYVIFPFAWGFFLSFENPQGAGGLPIQLEARVSEYLDLVMKLIFAFGITFQLPVALSLLAKVGIVTSAGLKKYRRYAIVGMFIVAAILAPPDVITQCGLAIPLIGLYEISIIAAKLVEPKPVEV